MNCTGYSASHRKRGSNEGKQGDQEKAIKFPLTIKLKTYKVSLYTNKLYCNKQLQHAIKLGSVSFTSLSLTDNDSSKTGRWGEETRKEETKSSLDSEAWWYKDSIAAPKRQMQVDLCALKASLFHTVGSRQARTTENVCKEKKKKPQKIVCVWLRYDKTLLSSKIQQFQSWWWNNSSLSPNYYLRTICGYGWVTIIRLMTQCKTHLPAYIPRNNTKHYTKCAILSCTVNMSNCQIQHCEVSNYIQAVISPICFIVF